MGLLSSYSQITKDNLYSEIIKQLPYPVFFKNRELNYVLCNKIYSGFFHLKPENIINKSDFDLFPEELAHAYRNDDIKVITTGEIIEKEEPFYLNNTKKTVYTIKTPVYDEKNKIIGLAGYFKDISKTKTAEKELKDSEHRFRALFYEDSTVKLLIDIESGNIIDANKSAIDFYGYSLNELKTMHISEINTLETSRIKKEMHYALEKEKKVFYFQHKIADGEIRDVRVFSTPIDVYGKKVLCSTIHDITEEKNALEALKQSEQKFKNVFNYSSDGMIVTNKENKIIDINNQAIEWTGFTKNELLYSNINSILLKDEAQKIVGAELLSKYNQHIPVEINTSKLLYGGDSGLLWILRDIRERKSIEKRILAATIETENKERMRLSEELHDDLAPLLSSIKMYSKMLKTKRSKSKADELAGIIHNLSQEAINITKNISNNLNPNLLTYYGLSNTIKSYCQKIENEGLVTIKLNLPGSLDFIKKENEIVLFRILKELINNTIKHAFADQIFLDIKTKNNMMEITYKDNGQGYNFEEELHKNSNRMGLINLVNRIKSLHGTFKTFNKSAGGFQIYISFKVEKLK